MIKLKQKYLFLLAVGAFLGLFLVDYFLLPSASIMAKESQNISNKQTDSAPSAPDIPKISEIKGPQIDQQAASVCRTEGTDTCGTDAASQCETLPPAIWIFLLVIYVSVLIFNLSFTFFDRWQIQWRWEALLTIFFLLEWFWFDQCRAHLWFPLYVLKLGIIIYAVYLYFLQKKRISEIEAELK